MQNFPILEMRKGDDVTISVNGRVVAQGLVESWSNDPADGGFAVNVKLFGGGYQWFYVREGATFSH